MHTEIQILKKGEDDDFFQWIYHKSFPSQQMLSLEEKPSYWSRRNWPT